MIVSYVKSFRISKVKGSLYPHTHWVSSSSGWEDERLAPWPSGCGSFGRMSRKWSQRPECLVNTLFHSALLQLSSLPQASGTFKHMHSQIIKKNKKTVQARNWIFVNCVSRTYHFLCNPEELRDITDHIPKAVIQTHIRPDPQWQLSLGITAFKPWGKVTCYSSCVELEKSGHESWSAPGVTC